MTGGPGALEFLRGRRILWCTEVAPVPPGRSPGMMLYSMGHARELQRLGLAVEICGLRFPRGRLASFLARGLYLLRVLLGAARSDLLVLGNTRLAALYPLFRALGCRVVAVCHDLPADAVLDQLFASDRRRLKAEIANKASKLRAIRGADALVAASRTTADDIREQAGPACPLRVIPNGFETPPQPGKPSPRQRDALREQAREIVEKKGRQWPDTPTLGLCVGALEARKNLPVLLDLVRLQAGGLGLVLVGTPKEGSLLRLVRRAEGEGLPLCHLEGLEAEELAALRAASDLLLAPSHYEGFGRAGLEAQASGLPVLASDIPAHREVLGKGAVLVRERRDPQAWAAALERLRDRQARSRLVADGLENARRFEPARLAPLWVAHLVAVLGENPGPPGDFPRETP